jgi:HAD superfamily 5'-nucleotidase-like hydrolase
MHGTKILDFDAQRDAYSRTIVDLSEGGWIFLNTLFSLSEGCMYAQVVDLLDQKLIPETLGYRELYQQIKHEVDTAHMEGQLKAEIIANPEPFVILDPETALTLLDQHYSGKKLLLITNSEWTYSAAMMSYALDRFLPKGMTWRDLFDVVIVSARKPDFFRTRSPLFEVVTPEGLLKPVTTAMTVKAAYLGGSARDVEDHLHLSGDEILYVGDHMFGDVKVTKDVLRWRTALILRELEAEIEAIAEFRPRETELALLMEKKEVLEAELCQIRLKLQRLKQKYGPPVKEKESDLQHRAEEIRTLHSRLDDQIGPLAKASTELSNPIWGLLMRAGNDKSHLAYQVERYADIYTSRVSNLLAATPFVYLRSTRGTLPHDPAPGLQLGRAD